MGVRITDTTLRDAHQSLLATRMPSFVILRSEATKNLEVGTARKQIAAVAPHHQIPRRARNDRQA